jgi:hypothetical protein
MITRRTFKPCNVSTGAAAIAGAASFTLNRTISRSPARVNSNADHVFVNEVEAGGCGSPDEVRRNVTS